MDKKVSVVGAGTSGLLAARELSRRGIDTTVYDQKKIVGVPVRASGIVSINGLKAMGIEYAKISTNVLRGARIHAGGRSMQITSAEPVANVLDRKALADLCIDEAGKAGAEIITGMRMHGSGLDGLSSDSVIIGADGPVSAVAAHFSMGPIKKYVLTYKAEFNVDVKDPEFVDLYFDNDEFPGLFAWACPNAKDILELGVGIDSRTGNSRKALDRFLGRREIKEMTDGAKMTDNGASMIPMSMREKIVDGRRKVLLVGDAAGQVKGTTGGGLVYGSAAALMAADAVSRNLESGQSLYAYAAAYRKRYRTEMLLHSMINRLYTSLGSASVGRLIWFMNLIGMDSFISKYGDMDMPSLLIKRFFVRNMA